MTYDIKKNGVIDGSDYVIAICDNGGGIDNAIIEQKFNGSISVKNDKTGALFTIRIPSSGEAC